jgi:di/tricarboxylate transporter
MPAIEGFAGLIIIFFQLHYLFASVTAHVTALLPVMLTVGTKIPGLPAGKAKMMTARTSLAGGEKSKSTRYKRQRRPGTALMPQVLE